MVEERERRIAVEMNGHIAKQVEIKRLYNTLRSVPHDNTPQQNRNQGRTMTQNLTGNGKKTMEPSAPLDLKILFSSKLEGFGVEKALSRLGGSIKLYNNLLTRFAANYKNAEPGMRAMLETGKFADLQREAHTVKGLAGSIGNDALSSAAGALEHLAGAAEGQAADSALSGQLNEAARTFFVLLANVVKTIEECLNVIAANDVSAKPAQNKIDIEKLCQGLTRLEALLSDNDAAAHSSFESMAESLKTVDKARYESIAAVIAEFDFEKALGKVRELKAALDKMPR